MINGLIRVLHVVTHMNRGGLETMLMNYYRHIDRKKVQFDFLTHRYGEKDYDNEILSLGGKIYHLPALNPFDKNYLKQLDQFFKKHTEYKIIHSHLDCMSTYPLKYAKKHEVPSRIAHSHNISQEKNLRYPLKMYARLQIPKYATHLFACGEEAGKWMYGKKRFRILNNAIDAKQFIYNEIISKKKKQELNLQGKFVVGHIGRFNIQKNHTFLIDIFSEVYKKFKDSVLVLIGVGDLQEVIKRKVNELGLSDAVIFLDLRSDISDILQAMDVFLFPSLFEGLPVTIVEAQASGLKCLISDKIPTQCVITKNVDVISLNESAEYWAEQVLAYVDGYIRRDMYKNIVDVKFDILENANELQEFYVNEYKKSKNF